MCVHVYLSLCFVVWCWCFAHYRDATLPCCVYSLHCMLGFITCDVSVAYITCLCLPKKCPFFFSNNNVSKWSEQNVAHCLPLVAKTQCCLSCLACRLGCCLLSSQGHCVVLRAAEFCCMLLWWLLSCDKPCLYIAILLRVSCITFVAVDSMFIPCVYVCACLYVCYVCIAYVYLCETTVALETKEAHDSLAFLAAFTSSVPLTAAVDRIRG